MIVISDSNILISEIIDGYPENSMERQLLEKMSKSTETYQYDTLSQLKFELSLRREIVDAARRLRRSRLRFAVFHKSECNEEYWDRTGNGGFLLKSGVKPWEAISDIFENGRKYATECATAMVIVHYGALLEVFSKEKFDEIFPSIYLMDWHELDPMLREIGRPKKVTDILFGDRCYFNNPDVDPKTPEWQGENVIVLSDGLYYGHGIGIANASQIIRGLNLNRKEGATQSAYFMEDSAARPNFKRLAKLQASRSDAPSPTVLCWRPFPDPVRGLRN